MWDTPTPHDPLWIITSTLSLSVEYVNMPKDSDRSPVRWCSHAKELFVWGKRKEKKMWQWLFLPVTCSAHLSHAVGQRRSSTGRRKGVAVPSSHNNQVRLPRLRSCGKNRLAIAQTSPSFAPAGLWGLPWELLLYDYVLSGKVLRCDKVGREGDTERQSERLATWILSCRNKWTVPAGHSSAAASALLPQWCDVVERATCALTRCCRTTTVKPPRVRRIITSATHIQNKTRSDDF